ncbi:MAG: hypothetical protein GY913_24015 [Proteobacteria bacterium]|nr:hypothetical protein [Pseudomonadota bacterium]MCP4919980.1 hypothetical protein [Pseudomonadota bacterium]
MRRWIGRVGLVLGGVLLGLVASEITARVIAPPGGAHLLFDAPLGEPDNLVQPDRELNTALRPGFSGEEILPGVRVDLRVNTLGLRGPELGERGDARRILTIGDSFTLAAQVAESDTFQSVLAQETGAEVFNGGVDGDSTWQSTRRYLRVEKLIEPDVVVLVYFTGNDPLDNERFRPGPMDPDPKPATAQPLDEMPPRLGGWERTLFRHSFVYAQWRVWDKQRSTPTQGPAIDRWRSEVELFTDQGRMTRERLLPRTERALIELRDLTKAAGDELVVAIAPPVFVVDQARLDPTLELVGLQAGTGQPDALRDDLVGILDRIGVTACDLTPGLRESQDAGESPYLQYDGHWAPDGHRAVGESLAGCLE